MSVLPTPSFDIAPGGRVAIIGAGCGGLETALALRAQGWTGPITVHDADPAWPYHKPPLSKAMLKGALPDPKSSIAPRPCWTATASRWIWARG